MNSQTKINGYRVLTEDEINLINRIKSVGIVLEQLIEEVDQTNLIIGRDSELVELANPSGWTHQAKINLQMGLMCLTRAVAKPTIF